MDLFNDLLGPRQPSVMDPWGTAHSVVAADVDLGIDIPATAYFAEALASLLWQAHGASEAHGGTMTFGPWIVTADSEVDWDALSGGDTPVFEVLYKHRDDAEAVHVATVDMNGLYG